ncbi:hypothetical protein [Lysobacter fragariae]
MAILSRWIAPAVLAVGFGTVALAPAPVRAQSSDDLVRVIVDVADVIYHGGQPYYRYGYGDYGYNDRLIVSRDRYGRPVYYRQVPRYSYDDSYRMGPPYGHAYGYRRNHQAALRTRVVCDRHGRCVTRYYDPRRDDRYGDGYGRYDNRYYSYDRRDRHYDDDRDHRRWRDRDDD